MIKLRHFLTLQIALGATFTLIILYAAGPQESRSFFIGAIFATVNLLALSYVVVRLFKKKSVATTAILIIFKYLIFGLCLYFLITSRHLSVAWFVVGLSIMLPTIISMGWIYGKGLKIETKKTERDDNKYGTF